MIQIILSLIVSALKADRWAVYQIDIAITNMQHPPSLDAVSVVPVRILGVGAPSLSTDVRHLT
ncbi:hypothetical protein HI914_04668 [Erysiphe necator]|nr:hypothetical protein HI914_04668 [Erysiphe necator]